MISRLIDFAFGCFYGCLIGVLVGLGVMLIIGGITGNGMKAQSAGYMAGMSCIPICGVLRVWLSIRSAKS